MNKVWMRRGIGSAVAAATIAAIVWALVPGPVDVEVAAVARGTFRKTIDEDGKTRVLERYVVTAPLAGRLLRIGLKPGDAVAPGTRVATLLPSLPVLLDERTERELAERVGAAEARQSATAASVERARVAIALARSEVERERNLGDRGFASKQAVERRERELELRGQELALAQFEAHAAEHELALARAALSRTAQAGAGRGGSQKFEVAAPVGGKVLRVVQESEAIVALGTPLLEVGDPQRLEVVVDVLTSDAESIKPGARVEFARTPDGVQLEGRVRTVEPSAFTKLSALGVEEQRVNVVIDFTSPPATTQALGDGYRVDATIVVDQRDNALLVPTSALFRRGADWAVYRFVDGRARLSNVRLGPRSGTQAVIEAGLAEADQVVIFPGDAVADGTRVKSRNGS
jgi:HlyD family secretion protein